MNIAEEPELFCDPRALLGDFKSDLWFPRYRVESREPWSLRVIPMSGTRGYWGQFYRVNGCAMLFGPGVNTADIDAWMSISPIEIESQEIGIRAARGHAVVLGLGMGWMVANVALRPEVCRVTVVERNPDVLALIEAQEIFEQLPEAARAKLEIVQADALDWRPDESVDSLLADIWPTLIDDRKLSDVCRMQKNIAAKQVYFWGQETEIWRAACRLADRTAVLDRALIDQVVANDIKLPLILSDRVDYPRQIANGAARWAGSNRNWWR